MPELSKKFPSALSNPLTRILLLLACSLALATSSQSQDPIYSQYFAAPLNINPALAGVAYAPRVGLNYRNQWPSLNAYQTYSLSYDQFLKNLNSGVGLMVLSDDAGDGLIKTNKIAGLFAYRIRVKNDWFVKIGVEGAWVERRYNWDKFLFVDQLDPLSGQVTAGGSPIPTEEERPDDPNRSYVDISTGMVVYNKKWHIGLSIKHLNRPDQGIITRSNNLFSGLPHRFALHGGAEINFRSSSRQKSDIYVAPNFLLVRQGEFGQINTGSLLWIKQFFVGAWYRYAWSNSDALIGVVGTRVGMFKIAYSYDYTMSSLGGTGGSHEISIIIKPKEPKESFNDCFRLFR